MWDPRATPARTLLRRWRVLIYCMLLTGERTETITLCLGNPEFWPDDCLIFITTKISYSSVSADICLSRSLQRVLKASLKECISFSIFGLTSILVNFQNKYATGCCFITRKQKRGEHLSSARKTPLCDQLPCGRAPPQEETVSILCV